MEPAGGAASGRAMAGPTRAVPGVAAQTTPAQTVSWSIPIALVMQVPCYCSPIYALMTCVLLFSISNAGPMLLITHLCTNDMCIAV